MGKIKYKSLLNLFGVAVLIGGIIFIIINLIANNNEKDASQVGNQEETYPYIENHQYNTCGVSESDSIYINSKYGIYRINKEDQEYSLFYDGLGYFGGLGYYKDWIYCIQGDGVTTNTSLIKISKDGKEVKSILSGNLFTHCLVVGDSLYTLNYTEGLVKGYTLNEYGELSNEISNTASNFLFKTYNQRQEKNSYAWYQNIDAYGPGFEAYNRFYYHIDIEKEYSSEASNYWVVKDSDTEEEITRIDVFNNQGIVMNGEIAYVDQNNLNALTFVDFTGKKIGDAKLGNQGILGIMNYDENWLYYYTATANSNVLCCRMNRESYAIEELFEVSQYSVPFSNVDHFFNVFDHFILYTEYDVDFNSSRLVLYNIEDQSKKVIGP